MKYSEHFFSTPQEERAPGCRLPRPLNQHRDPTVQSRAGQVHTAPLTCLLTLLGTWARPPCFASKSIGSSLSYCFWGFPLLFTTSPQLFTRSSNRIDAFTPFHIVAPPPVEASISPLQCEPLGGRAYGPPASPVPALCLTHICLLNWITRYLQLKGAWQSISFLVLQTRI